MTIFDERTFFAMLMAYEPKPEPITLTPVTPGIAPAYLGTVTHSRHGRAVGINQDYKSTLNTRRYMCGLEPANYPVPAIPLAVVWPDDMGYVGYRDMLYIDNVQDPDDPVMVCAWDFYKGEHTLGHGEYTRCNTVREK